MTKKLKKPSDSRRLFNLLLLMMSVLNASACDPGSVTNCMVSSPGQAQQMLIEIMLPGSKKNYHPNMYAKIKGTTIVASLSTIYFGVLISSFPQVIFSFGTAPE